MWHYGQNQVSVLFADDLVPTWHQGICSYNGDIAWLVPVRSTNVMNWNGSLYFSLETADALILNLYVINSLHLIDWTFLFTVA